MRDRTGGVKTTAVASVGLCLAATVALLLPSPSLAFRPHAIGAARTHNSWRRSSAACRLAARNIGGATGGDDSEHERRRLEHAAAAEAAARQNKGNKASKDVAALVLSALLLGNPQLSDAATPVRAVGAASGRPDATTQDRLLADLEEKLMSLPSPEDERSPSQEDATSQSNAASSRQQSTRETAQQQQPARIQAVGAPPPSTTAAQQAARATVDTSSADLGTAPSRGRAPTVGVFGTGEPIVKLQEYTFSVTLPELNLPPIAPVTLPEEGGLFQMPKRSERVEASPNVPMGRVIKDALVRAEKGGDVESFFSAISARMPKQAGYYRTMEQLEQRVHNNIKTLDNPMFASGVPLSPEFTSMFNQAKENALKITKPFLPKGVEPELAIFMLATLPVLTVALRAADENSRRPKAPPLSPAARVATKYRPPRSTRFPNSPAKVDAEAFGEARAAEAAAKATAKATAEAAAKAAAKVAAPSVTAVESAEVGVTAAAGELKGGVEAAVAVGEDKLRAELAKLREDLSATTKLAAKLEALEKANARLMEQVSALSKQPSLQDMDVRAEKEEARVALRREREAQQEAVYRNVEEKASKISSAREILAESFPAPEEAKEAPAATVDVEVSDLEPAPVAVPKKKRAARKTTAGTPKVATRKKTTPKTSVAKAEAKGAAGAGAGAGGKAKKKAEKPAPVQNGAEDGGEREEGGVEAPPGQRVAETPDDFDDLSEDLSRALRGVEGFDLDALDLEMDDLRPEDIEELRNLEREMGDLDMASLEAEFDHEDDEAISHALRMAAESAMAHTSGGGRRIRTASAVGATSSRAAAGGGLGDDGDTAAAAAAAAAPGAAARLTSSVELSDPEEGFEGDDEWVYPADGMEMAPPGGVEMGGEWASLTTTDLKRKTVAELKGFLADVGVEYKGKPKKAELLDKVSEVLQAA